MSRCLSCLVVGVVLATTLGCSEAVIDQKDLLEMCNAELVGPRSVRVTYPQQHAHRLKFYVFDESQTFAPDLERGVSKTVTYHPYRVTLNPEGVWHIPPDRFTGGHLVNIAAKVDDGPIMPLPRPWKRLLCGPSPSVADRSSPLGELEDRHATWTADRARIIKVIEQRGKEKADLVAKLHALGVAAEGDFPTKPEAKLLAEELVELSEQIGALEEQRMTYDSALPKLESVMRRLKRRSDLDKLAVLSEDENADLARAKLELDEGAAIIRDRGILQEAQRSEILRRELGGK